MIEPKTRGLRGSVAHGPEKHYDRTRNAIPIQVTAPPEQIRWLRTNGFVASWVFREAVSRLMDGGEAAHLEQQLLYHREQIAILEASRETLSANQKRVSESQAREAEVLAALTKLSEEFFSAGREKFHRANNLNWLRERLAHSRLLRGRRPDDTLVTILASRAEVQS